MTVITTSPHVRPIISADSHVIEPVAIWEGLVPMAWWGDLPRSFGERPGGFDPKARTDEMDVDGVAAEVLYPSLALKLFADEDTEHQTACLRRYNQWLIDYCAVAPDRLAGIGQIATYDIDSAIADAQWCRTNGLRGVEVWMSPPAHLPFNGNHYEAFWEACGELSLPVSLHIHSGFDYSKEMLDHPDPVSTGDQIFKWNVNQKLLAVMNALVELVLSGVLDRHRDLRLVLVENEVGWLPFFIDQLDYYYRRSKGHGGPVQLERLPSEIFREQVSATFFRDPDAAYVARRFGESIMWSSDYPHGNSTWPKSQEVVTDRLGELPDELVRRLVWDNVIMLYGLEVPMTAGADGD